MAQAREILKANRRAKRKQYWRRMIMATILIVVVLTLGGWYLWNIPALALTRIVVVGAKKISTERLTSAIEKILAGQYLGLFNHRVNWFYPREIILKSLPQRFPELALVNVTNPSVGTLRVEVVERQPTALWCEEKPTCYFIDQTGLIYAPAPYFSNSPLVTLTGPALPIPIGSRPLPISNFESLRALELTINQQLQTNNDLAFQMIEAVALAEPVDYVFEVRNRRQQSHGWQLLVARQTPIATALSRLTSALASPAFLADYHSATTSLESIDVRFGRKVFYKFR
ncbi:MAG: hypothetical protein V1704_00695 [Candidatus Vogelbacteria bacterium]